MNIDYRIDICERTGYPKPLPVSKHTCCICGENIYSGEDYYDYFGDTVCDECELDYRHEHFRRTVTDDA